MEEIHNPTRKTLLERMIWVDVHLPAVSESVTG